MSSRRTLKAAEAIREVVAMSILTDLKDPRVRNTTVTSVEVSGDMRYAKVFIFVRGTEKQQQLSLKGLQSAAGFLQAKCAARIDTRYTPRIQFQLDEGQKKALEINKILMEMYPGGIPGDSIPDDGVVSDSDVSDSDAEDVSDDDISDNNGESGTLS
ncbi:MAG: 30S ribosome-binding factor RbfA [Planctomycetaceae bacterium]|jgi:ribosome-binding factor A|nr:30S ribosome-binding factor RbfA [Planctomycetaceae bacterium]